MAPILKLFRATIGTDRQYFFLQSPTSYTGSLDTVTGITAAADSEQDEPPTSVQNLVSKGVLFRVAIQYTSGTGRKSAKLLVTKAKLATALDDLIGKSFRGGSITSARIPQKAQFF